MTPEKQQIASNWCQHIEWYAACSGKFFWWIEIDDDSLKECFPNQDCVETRHVPKSWTCCPICGAKRPPINPDGDSEDVAKLLQDQGYKTVIGADAVRAAIAAESDGSTEVLCSGYGVLPNGTKCGGCKDCNNDKTK